MKAVVLTMIVFLISLCPAYGSEGMNEAQLVQQYKTKIYGTIEALPSSGTGPWIVNGREVVVTRDTRIDEEHGRVAVGAFVEVKGTFTGRELIAEKIEVKRDSSHAKLYGVVESIPAGGLGIWIIDGKRVLVNERTEIDEEHGRAVVGAYVEVKGSYSGKDFAAREVEVKRSRR